MLVFRNSFGIKHERHVTNT